MQIRNLFYIVLLFSVSNPDLLLSQNNNTHDQFLKAVIGGSGGIYTLQFEQNFHPETADKLFWNAGFSYTPFFGKSVVALPFGFACHFFNGKNQLRAGTGQVILLGFGEEHPLFFRGTADISYLYVPTDRHISFQIGYTPFYSYLNNFQWNHWGGIGINWKILKS